VTAAHQIPHGATVPLSVAVFDVLSHQFEASQYEFMNLTFSTDTHTIAVSQSSGVGGDVAFTVTGVSVGITTLQASVVNCVHAASVAAALSDGATVWRGDGDSGHCWRVSSVLLDVEVFAPLTLIPGRVGLLPDAK
jgi:hypothetical protein